MGFSVLCSSIAAHLVHQGRLPAPLPAEAHSTLGSSPASRPHSLASHVRRRVQRGSLREATARWILTPQDTVAFSRYPSELLPRQDLTFLIAWDLPLLLISLGGLRWWRSGGAPRGSLREATARGMGRARDRRCRPTTRSPPPSPSAGEGPPHCFLVLGLACNFFVCDCVKSVTNSLVSWRVSAYDSVALS
jgi:hypothetical protein